MPTQEEPADVLEEAYRQYSDYVFSVCLRFAGGDRDWALDRAHDVFIRLNDNLKHLDLARDLRPWLRRVAANECLMDLRKRERRQRLLRVFGRTPTERVPLPERQYGLSRDTQALDEALGDLPQNQRRLLGLMYFDGESLTDAAKRIGVSKGQASKLHKRALAALSRYEWESEA